MKFPKNVTMKINYKYRIVYKSKEPCKRRGDARNSRYFDDELTAYKMFNATHRTASLWKTWHDKDKGDRWQLLEFKVVYSEKEIQTMHPNLLKLKYQDYKEKMTSPTLKRFQAIAKRKGIIIN